MKLWTIIVDIDACNPEKISEEVSYHDLYLAIMIMATTSSSSLANVFSFYFHGNVPLAVLVTSTSMILAMGIQPLNLTIYYDGDISLPIVPLIKAYATNIGCMFGGIIIAKILQTFAPNYHSVSKLKKIGPVVGVFVLIIGGVTGLLLIQNSVDFMKDYKMWISGIFHPIIGYCVGYTFGIFMFAIFRYRPKESRKRYLFYYFKYLFFKYENSEKRKKMDKQYRELMTLGLVCAIQNPQYAIGATINNDSIDYYFVYPLIYGLCQILELSIIMGIMRIYRYRRAKLETKSADFTFDYEPDESYYEEADGVQRNTIDPRTGAMLRDKTKRLKIKNVIQSKDKSFLFRNKTKVKKQKELFYAENPAFDHGHSEKVVPLPVDDLSSDYKTFRSRATLDRYVHFISQKDIEPAITATAELKRKNFSGKIIDKLAAKISDSDIYHTFRSLSIFSKDTPDEEKRPNIIDNRDSIFGSYSSMTEIDWHEFDNPFNTPLPASPRHTRIFSTHDILEDSARFDITPAREMWRAEINNLSIPASLWNNNIYDPQTTYNTIRNILDTDIPMGRTRQRKPRSASNTVKFDIRPDELSEWRNRSNTLPAEPVIKAEEVIKLDQKKPKRRAPVKQISRFSVMSVDPDSNIGESFGNSGVSAVREKLAEIFVEDEKVKKKKTIKSKKRKKVIKINKNETTTADYDLVTIQKDRIEKIEVESICSSIIDLDKVVETQGRFTITTKTNEFEKYLTDQENAKI